MISQIFTQDCFKIITLFSLSPGSRFKRNEIKNKTKLNNVPLDKALTNLINSGIIKKEKKYYFINFENDYTKKILEICTKQFKQLKELPLNVYYALIDLITYFSSIKDIELFLFGSYAKLIYKETSDIDIALLYLRELNKKQIIKLINKLEKIYDKKIEIHYFERKGFYKNKKDYLVREILKNGVKLIYTKGPK